MEGTKKPVHPKIIKDGWNRVRFRTKSVAELGGWKNDNRVERHDRRGQKGGGQRGNRGESIRSYYRHPIKGGRAAGIVPMVYIYRSKSSFSLSLPFSTCVLCDCAWYTINLKSFVPQLSTFSREREISSSPEEREYLTLYTITCSMITDLCYCSSKFSWSSNGYNIHVNIMNTGTI